MTAHPTRIFTEGETALFEAFDRADFGDRTQARAAALSALKATGLPTRRVEAFHYTDLRALLKGSFKVSDQPTDAASRDATKGIGPLVKDAAVAHFRDGWFVETGPAMPKGVTLTQGLPESAENADAANTLGLLNTAFGRGGATLSIAEGVDVTDTIGLATAHTGAANVLAAQRVAVNVGKGARARVIERAVGHDGDRYLNSTHVDLEIGEGADVTYVLSNEEGDAATRLARLSVTLHKDAALKLFVMNVGGKLVRQEIIFDVRGEGATLDIAGVNMVGDEAHLDVTSIITHHVPGTTATELMRNVAAQRGSGVFQGRINVAQPAQLTDARMACNTLLLSDDCSFSAKPELEIFADDVQCAHGATVTDLEESYLFYLMARGIPENRARRLLIKAFVAEAFQTMEDEALEEALEERMEAWLDRHA